MEDKERIREAQGPMELYHKMMMLIIIIIKD